MLPLFVPVYTRESAAKPRGAVMTLILRSAEVPLRIQTNVFSSVSAGATRMPSEFT